MSSTIHNKKYLINNLDFAQSGQQLSGELYLSDCIRLSDSLANEGQGFKLNYTLLGQANLGLEPRLNLQIHALLPCVCQRCLESVNIALDLKFNYVVGAEVIDDEDAMDDLDWLEADIEMDLGALIEDEVLIAFPFAPMHEDCNAVTMVSGEKSNPFAALKALKK